VVGTVSRSCPVTRFGISDVEPLYFAARELAFLGEFNDVIRTVTFGECGAAVQSCLASRLWAAMLVRPALCNMSAAACCEAVGRL
jgi:hypothetical protein